MSIFFKPEERDKSIFPHDVFKSLVVQSPIGWIPPLVKKEKLTYLLTVFFLVVILMNIVSFCPEGNKDRKILF